MKKVFLASIALIMATVSYGLPFTILAQDNAAANTNPAVRTGPDGGIGTNDPAQPGFQFVTCSGVDDPRTKNIKEKECTFEDLVLTARRIIYFVLSIITPILIAMLVYTGFKYIMAGGDVSLVADAKRMLKPIIIGLILIFSAWIVVYTLLDKILAPMIGDVSRDSILPPL